jgi:hypothetical protein
MPFSLVPALAALVALRALEPESLNTPEYAADRETQRDSREWREREPEYDRARGKKSSVKSPCPGTMHTQRMHRQPDW